MLAIFRMKAIYGYKIQLLLVWLLFVVVFMQEATTDSVASPLIGPEHKLYLHLFTDYTSDSRPVKNASHRVVINFDLSLNQLLDLDEKNQILTTSVWIYEEWTDEMLKWSPEDYEGQRAIMIPASNIWLPDIFIFNTANANMDGFVNVNGSKVAIQYNGNVKWMVPLMISSVCAVDVTYFPYDRQTCTIKFGSWIYDTEQVEIFSDATTPDLEHYVMNSEYDLRHVSISRGIMEGSCCPGEGLHSMVEMRIELGRKSLYYDYIVIAPTIMLCVLTLASFLLPCDRGEKMAIGLTVFLTLYVLQLRIADNVPDTNSTPILGVFLLIVMTFNCVSLIMATLVMNIKKRGDYTPCPAVPTWLFWMCHNVFGRVVCTRYLWKDLIQYPKMLNTEEINKIVDGSKDTSDHNKESTSSRNSQFNQSSAKSLKVRQIKGQTSSTEHGSRRNGKASKEKSRRQRRASGTNSEQDDAVPFGKPQTRDGKSSPSTNSRRALPSENHSTDFSSAQRLNREEEIEMRLRRPKNTSQNLETCGSSNQELCGSASNGPYPSSSGEESLSYLMKRRWFFVAEVVDKFLFIVYLVLLTCSIFTVLFLIPTYFRNDK